MDTDSQEYIAITDKIADADTEDTVFGKRWSSQIIYSQNNTSCRFLGQKTTYWKQYGVSKRKNSLPLLCDNKFNTPTRLVSQQAVGQFHLDYPDAGKSYAMRSPLNFIRGRLDKAITKNLEVLGYV